jgi:hypothetical protein
MKSEAVTDSASPETPTPLRCGDLLDVFVEAVENGYDLVAPLASLNVCIEVMAADVSRLNELERLLTLARVATSSFQVICYAPEWAAFNSFRECADASLKFAEGR